jgi:hypothetical protein
MRTMCDGDAPPAASTATALASACAAWSARRSDANSLRSFHPIMPATKTIRPRALTPFA